MSWLDSSAVQASLPDNCAPTNDFLLRFSSTFHVCLPTPLAFASNLLGILSICSWLFAQLPQIYKNFSLQSTSGLSILFLAEWCLGDAGGLLGALFTHQAKWQVVIGGYYLFVDLCLVMQWVWYEKLKHGRYLLRVRPKDGSGHGHGQDGAGDMDEVVIEGVDPRPSNGESQVEVVNKVVRPRPIFRTPTFRRDRSPDEKTSTSLSKTPGGSSIQRVGSSSPMPSPSPRTMLLIACVIAMAQASPLRRPGAGSQFLARSTFKTATSLERVGTVLSWVSTFLYLGSRLPQLYKNYRRKSTAGLSPTLFAAAFCGNFFYSAAILTNPRAWYDMGPYGGGGWVGYSGSNRAEWVVASLPFFVGAAGVLFLDAGVGLQFLHYGESETKVVVVEEGRGMRWRWRRVSGWMRGWVPSISDASSNSGERSALKRTPEGQGSGYGGL